VNFGYWLAGVRFDDNGLTWYPQFLDNEILRHHLLRGLFYLHTQPPLYNLYLGTVLKIAPEHYVAVYYGVHLMLGVVVELSLFWLLLRLRVGTITAAVTAGLYVATPDFILYENWLYYALTDSALVVLSAVFLVEFLRSRRTWAVACFFVALFVLCGVRSMFHLGFFLLLAAALTLACRAQWRKVLLAAAVPGLLLTAIYLKNFLIVGQFTASTWFGLNPWSMTARNLPLAEKEELVRQGVLTPISLIERESALEKYPPEYTDAAAFPQVPELVAWRKSSGANNYNHVGYISINRAYGKDALAALIHRPRSYLIGLGRAYFSYFKASGDYPYPRYHNGPHVEPLATIVQYGLYGKIPFDLATLPAIPLRDRTNHYYIYLFLLLGLPALVIYGLVLLIRGARKRSLAEFTFAQYGLLLYAIFVIAYVCFVGNMFEGGGENNRFRFEAEGCYVVLLGLFIDRVLIGWWRRRRGLATPLSHDHAATMT